MLLSSEKAFKARLLNYQIGLESTGDLTEKGEHATNFNGIVDINLNYAARTEVSHENVLTVQKLLAEGTAVYDFNTINERRAKHPELMVP